jgi:hypothetical protein
MRPSFVTYVLVAVLSGSLACGTLLYPERRSMKDPGRIDPVVLLLDGALLLVFVIPGLVAFAVDIATGAIYQPEGEDWARRDGDARVRVVASRLGALELHAPPVLRAGAWSIRWETADNDPVPAHLVRDGESGRYRLQTPARVGPGSYWLVVSLADGTEHRVPVTVL